MPWPPSTIHPVANADESYPPINHGFSGGRTTGNRYSQNGHPNSRPCHARNHACFRSKLPPFPHSYTRPPSKPVGPPKKVGVQHVGSAWVEPHGYAFFAVRRSGWPTTSSGAPLRRGVGDVDPSHGPGVSVWRASTPGVESFGVRRELRAR